MERLIIVLPVLIAAVGIALWVQRRPPAAPAQPVEHEAPVQLDRNDFDGADKPWLVAVFTSSTCGGCADVASKVEVLACDEVVTQELEFSRDRAIHERYHVTAVPTVVIADAAGVVRRSFMGATSAAHLWAAVADLRGTDATD